MKKIFVIASAILLGLFLLTLLVTFYNGSCKGFEIQINNLTGSQVEGLKITYNGLKEDILIKPINPESTYSFNVKPQEVFEGSSLKIYQFDKLGNRHEKILVEHFEKGNWGRVLLDITSIDEFNKITFRIRESSTIGKVERGNTEMLTFVGGFIILYFLLIIFVFLFVLVLKALKVLNIYFGEHQKRL